jgi:drug/metabolite transporter (DMT)-like permease
MSDRVRRRAVAQALLVTVLWSSSLVFAGLRYGLAAIVVTVLLLARPRMRRATGELGWPTLARLAVLGLVFYAVTQGAQFVAIARQPEATTSLLLALTPLVVAVAARPLLDEPATFRQVAGAVLVGVGALGYFTGSLGGTVVGMTAALVALAGNCTSALLGRHTNRAGDLPPLIVTALSMVCGAGVLLAAGVLTEGVPSITARGWVIVVWLAVVNTAWAFTMWNAALRWLTATESALVNNTMLVQVAVLAWIFLGEQPSLRQWAGIVGVAAGVALTQIGGDRSRYLVETDA